MALRRCLLLFLSVLVCGCSANSSRESEQDRWMALLNERRYDEVATELERALAANPGDEETAYLLSMAYLGEGHAEILDFLQRALSEQPEETPGSALKRSHCDQSSWDKHSLKGKSISCILERLMNQTPDHENQGVRKASTLLLQYFPDPKITSHDTNFLIAYVQLYRALNRARLLTSDQHYGQIQRLRKGKKFPRPEAERLFSFTVHNLKSLFAELMETIRRLKYSYSKIAKHTKSLDGKPLLEWRGHQLLFDDQLTPGRLARFGLVILAEKEDSLDKSVNEEINGQLHAIAPKLIQSGRTLKFLSRSSGTEDNFNLSFKVARGLESLLRSIEEPGQDQGESIVPRISESLWQHPPGIFGQMGKALGDAWESESLTPLYEFQEQTADEWRALHHISSRWEILLEKSEVQALRSELGNYFHGRRQNEATFLLPPQHLGKEEMLAYTKSVEEECDRALLLMVNGDIPGFDRLTPADQAEVLSVWSDAKSWLEKNVFSYEK